MKHRSSLSAFVLLSVVSLFGQGATPPEQAESHVGDSAAPDSLESLKTLADSKLSVEHNKEVTVEQDAVAAAKEAIRADPTDGFAWSKLGDAYFQLGDYKNAKDATEKAIEIFTERFKKAPSPAECEGMKILSERQQPNGPARIVCHDEASTNLSMLASSYVQMATICHRLHKKREASRYENLALRAFDVMRLMQPSSRLPATNAQVQHSQNNGAPRPTQTAPVSPPRPALTPAPPVPQCQLPVHELCQYPTFRPQPYDPNNPHPYVAPDTRDYDRCVVGNQREDARYQQCYPSGPEFAHAERTRVVVLRYERDYDFRVVKFCLDKCFEILSSRNALIFKGCAEYLLLAYVDAAFKEATKRICELLICTCVTDKNICHLIKPPMNLHFPFTPTVYGIQSPLGICTQCRHRGKRFG